MSITKGDTVHWNTSPGRTIGTAVEKKTTQLQHDGRTFDESSGEPWGGESDKGGASAAHQDSTREKG